MTLIKFEPLREFESFSNRLQRIFDEFSGDISTQFNPKVDISEDDDKIFVDVEAPGMNKEDISISLQDNILTIKGEKRNETEEKKGKNYYRSERCYGAFQRSFTLPAEIDREKAEAKFENGILQISIAKSQPKKISERNIKIK